MAYNNQQCEACGVNQLASYAKVAGKFMLGRQRFNLCLGGKLGGGGAHRQVMLHFNRMM